MFCIMNLKMMDGTEPKIKLYIGVKDESEEKAINKMEELKEELSKIIK